MKTDKNANPLKAQPCGFKDLQFKNGEIICAVCDQPVRSKWLTDEQRKVISFKALK